MPIDMKPFLSVVIPVYNGAKTIGPCIESLLNQSYPAERYEIIVVNNSSSDNTREIILRYPVLYVEENQKKGVAPARNKGAKAAKGEGLAFFDADQVATPDYLCKLVNGWDDPKNGVLVGRNIGVDTQNNALGQYWVSEWKLKKPQLSITDRRLPFFSGGIVIIRTAVFVKLNGFDERFSSFEDVDFSWRVQKELNLSLRFNLDAISYHKDREKVSELLKREFNFGVGEVLFEQKHEEANKSNLRLFLKVCMRTVLGVLAAFWGLLKCPFGKTRKGHFQLISIDVAMNWVNIIGRIYGKLNLVLSDKGNNKHESKS